MRNVREDVANCRLPAHWERSRHQRLRDLQRKHGRNQNRQVDLWNLPISLENDVNHVRSLHDSAIRDSLLRGTNNMCSVAEKLVVGLGEVLWDCFGNSKRPGGAPANVAFHAQQLGHRGIICSAIGDDELGRELEKYLMARGLETRLIQKDLEHPTGRVTVDISNPEMPSYIIHEHAAWDHIVFTHDLGATIRRAAAVCFGTLAQRNEKSRSTIHHALATTNNALIVYDVNLRQSWYEAEWIEQSMHAAHVVKLNIDEVATIGKILNISTGDHLSFAGELRDRYDVETVCITRADEGCLISGKNEHADVPGEKVLVSDAVGAGDAFTAALISAILRGWSLQQAATFANKVGALVAANAGAMPFLQREYMTIASQMNDRTLPQGKQ